MSIISNHSEGGLDVDTGFLSDLVLSLKDTIIAYNTNNSLRASGLAIQSDSKYTCNDILITNTSFENNFNLRRRANYCVFIRSYKLYY